MKKLAFATLLGMNILTGRVVQAADLEAAEKAIIDLTAQTKSLEVHSKTTQSFSQQGHDLDTLMDGMYAFLRKGDRLLYRSDVKNRNVLKKPDGTSAQTETRSLIINDGEFVYALNEGPDGKSAMKNMANANISYVVDRVYFDRLAKQYSVELASEETVNDKPHYVIECSARNTPPGGVAKMRLYFDKKTGVNTKTVGIDSDGKTIMTTTATEIKVNPSLPDDYFIFKAPEGVEVKDVTHSPEKSRQPSPAPTPAEEVPKKP
ncbi:MAG: outer membrane lipoprotein carrier protein LolA [Planctomycetes bacterium]|nr:outer membrane lipoprotein carrier protein LolA [Planctomycetota bacterium]MBI3835783.1 outer membrane lipoprotein carrier protein LolA [Planctomycetota bacterium]